jgi:7-cyano-7-deazaguanine synthase
MNSIADNAIVLLSGGMDSATTLAIAQKQHSHLQALTFSYGQRHSVEVKAAQKIAEDMEVEEHIILNIPLGEIVSSALTDPGGNIATNRSPEQIGHGIPATYVPARNLIFLSYALARAESVNANNIYIGVTTVDYSGYPDCRPEFIKAFQEIARLATRAGSEGRVINICTPLQNMSKSQIISLGHSLGVDYSRTVSCYKADPQGRGCGTCDACILRKEGFKEAGIADPTRYQKD